MASKRSQIPKILHCLTYLREDKYTGNQATFDSDSFIIGFDSHASNMISNQRSHLIRNVVPLLHQHIKCISGQISIKGQGTVRYKIEKYEVRVHTLDIRDALYVPESPIYILCPQHWYQKVNSNLPTRRGPYMVNFDN